MSVHAAEVEIKLILMKLSLCIEICITIVKEHYITIKRVFWLFAFHWFERIHSIINIYLWCIICFCGFVCFASFVWSQTVLPVMSWCLCRRVSVCTHYVQHCHEQRDEQTEKHQQQPQRRPGGPTIKQRRDPADAKGKLRVPALTHKHISQHLLKIQPRIIIKHPLVIFSLTHSS